MILLINQTVLVLEVDHCLCCPMQCRIDGVKINEMPRFLTSHFTTSSHSIMIANSMDDAHQFTIPIQLEGVVSYFEYTLPTSAVYQDEDIPHLELTTESPAWEPYNDDFALQEETHDALGHLFEWEGVPSEESLTESARRLRATCGALSPILYGLTPLSMRLGNSRRAQPETDLVRRLWCFAQEYKSYVHLHTAHNFYQFDGHVPETVILGETADMIPFCEFGF
ncbi:hypothetical protein ACHAW6_001600 [Cyclotella cf. meneghiniana]